MWFENLMDDFKSSLQSAFDNQGIFIPIFLKLGVGILMAAYFVYFLIKWIVGSSYFLSAPYRLFPELIWRTFKGAAVPIIVAYILFGLLYAVIEVGQINLLSALMRGQKPTMQVFKEGIGHYFGKVFGGRLFIHLLALILSPILLILGVIYALTVGILSGGWAIVLLTVTIQALFASWTIALVHHDLGFFEALGMSFKLARYQYKTVALIVWSSAVLQAYAIGIFGPVGIFFAGWFIGGVISIYMKLVLYKAYVRLTEVDTYSDVEASLMSPVEDETPLT